MNVTSPEPVRNREFTSTLGRVLSRPTVLPVPAHGLRLIFGEMADATLLASTRVVPQRLLELGFQFQHSALEPALRDVLRRGARSYFSLMTRANAVVLLSGGMDSATTAALAMSRGFEVHALTFRYGQRHQAELEAARRVAERLGVAQHVVLNIDLRALGGSALTADIPVPKDTPLEAIGQHIPVTYVPARNTIFLSFALGLAEVLGSTDIFLGANALDYSGYPDCRPEFMRAFEAMANLATRAATEQGRQDHDPYAFDPAVEAGDRRARARASALITGSRSRATIPLLKGLPAGDAMRACYD